MLTCTAAVHATSLGVPFQFDDRGVVPVITPPPFLLGWSLHGLRPLLRLSYAASAALQLGPPGYHLFNVAVHLAAVALVMALAEAASSPGSTWPFRPTSAAPILAGLLFALHPVQTEAVTYVSGRSSSLMAVFYLAATLVYVQGVRSRRAVLWAVAAPTMWACAMLVKESAAALPLALLAWELCIERSRPRDLLLRQGLVAALGGVALIGLILNDRTYSLLYSVLGSRPPGDALRYQIHGMAYLASRLVLLRSLSIDPGLGFAPLPPYFAAEAAGLAVVVAAALASRRRPVVLGVTWWMLHLLVPYAMLSRTDVINERHMYLANAGLAIGAGSLLAELRPRVAAAAALTIAAVLAIATVARNRDYATPIALWEQTVRVSPENPRAHNNLGTAYEAAGRLDDAKACYRHALELEPRYESARRYLERLR